MRDGDAGSSAMSRLIAFATTAAVTCATAPIIRRFMVHNGTLDIPNHRSSHVEPIPRGGGLATVAGMASALSTTRGVVPMRVTVPVVALAAIGYMDDYKSTSGGLPAAGRMVVQLGVGALIADRTVLSCISAPIIVAGVVNVVNFMDGINGISALTAIVWGINAQFRQASEVQLLGALAAGAGVGFLPWNVPTAKLFLGDTGSYFLGGVMAAAIIRTLRPHHPISDSLRLAAPLLPYVADATQAILRRARSGKRLTEPHREHVYQKVVDSGRLDHLQMASAHAAVAAGCSVVWTRCPPVVAVAFSGMACALYVTLPAALQRKRQ